MDIETQARAFRQAVAALGPRKRNTPYPNPLRLKALAYLQLRQKDGIPFPHIARELALDPTTLKSWLRRHAPPPLFRPLSLAQDHPAHPTSTPPPPLLVTGPKGLCVTGLSLDQLVLLWQKLSC